MFDPRNSISSLTRKPTSTYQKTNPPTPPKKKLQDKLPTVASLMPMRMLLKMKSYYHTRILFLPLAFHPVNHHHTGCGYASIEPQEMSHSFEIVTKFSQKQPELNLGICILFGICLEIQVSLNRVENLNHKGFFSFKPTQPVFVGKFIPFENDFGILFYRFIVDHVHRFL